MPVIPAFHAVDEVKQPPDKRVYHDNTTCIQGRLVPRNERLAGTGGFAHCGECAQKAKQGR